MIYVVTSDLMNSPDGWHVNACWIRRDPLPSDIDPDDKRSVVRAAKRAASVAGCRTDIALADVYAGHAPFARLLGTCIGIWIETDETDGD